MTGAPPQRAFADAVRVVGFVFAVVVTGFVEVLLADFAAGFVVTLVAAGAAFLVAAEEAFGAVVDFGL